MYLLRENNEAHLWAIKTSYNINNAEAVYLTDSRVYYNSAPAPSTMISALQLWHNSEYGISVQRDKTGNEFYVPYTNEKVGLSSLLNEARHSRWLAEIEAANSGCEHSSDRNLLIKYLIF